MDTLSIPEAKEKLEDLIARASRGEDVRISDPKHGTVKLQVVAASAVTPLKAPRRLGHLAGKVKVPDDLLAPMTEEELRDWYGDDP